MLRPYVVGGPEARACGRWSWECLEEGLWECLEAKRGPRNFDETMGRWSKLTFMGALLAELLLPSPSAIGARWSARLSLRSELCGPFAGDGHPGRLHAGSARNRWRRGHGSGPCRRWHSGGARLHRTTGCLGPAGDARRHSCAHRSHRRILGAGGWAAGEGVGQAGRSEEPLPSPGADRRIWRPNGRYGRNHRRTCQRRPSHVRFEQQPRVRKQERRESGETISFSRGE